MKQKPILYLSRVWYYTFNKRKEVIYYWIF